MVCGVWAGWVGRVGEPPLEAGQHPLHEGVHLPGVVRRG